jgi:hypothetical protein
MKQRQPKVVPDIAHRGMTRVRWPDGRLSDMTNLTRAKDAVACLIETEERRQRGRHRPSEGRRYVKAGHRNERQCRLRLHESPVSFLLLIAVRSFVRRSAASMLLWPD